MNLKNEFCRHINTERKMSLYSKYFNEYQDCQEKLVYARMVLDGYDQDFDKGVCIQTINRSDMNKTEIPMYRLKDGRLFLKTMEIKDKSELKYVRKILKKYDYDIKEIYRYINIPF